MAGVNQVTLLGRLGADPETKQANGKTVTKLSVATSEKSKDKEYTEWHRVIVWGNTADACAKYLSKGREVFVQGRLQTRSFENKKGDKVFTTEIIANSVQFIGGGNQSNQDDEAW